MKKQLRLVLIISILASFVAFLDSSIVNVALPAISKELGGGLVGQQWIVDAYLLTLGSFILIAGSLSDLFGRKKILTAGLIGFMAASLLCALAPNITVLIIGRALQGCAGALLVPSSLALIISAFKGHAQGKAIGSWTAWTGISFIVGPLLGGFLVDAASWRWTFGINVLPILVTLGLIKLLDAPEELPGGAKIDSIGALLCIISLGGPVYGFIEQSRFGWHSPHVFIPIIVGVVAAVAFVLYEQQHPKPMLPLELFKVRNFSFGNMATFAIYAGLSIATFTIVLFLQQIGNFSALQAGMALLPITLIMFVLSSRFGALAGKYGPRLFMTAGPIVASLGFLSFLRVNEHITYWSQILPGILIFGLGLSMTVAPLTSAVLSDIDSKHAGVGSAINNAVSRISGLVAISLLGFVIGANAFTGTTAHGVSALHKAALAMSLLLLCGGLISLIGIRNKVKSSAQT